MMRWFYKEKNSARILFAVATWLFVYVGIAFVGLLGAANGFTTMTPEELENPTLETSLIALVMLLIMGISCLPGIFFTVHAVKAYKADKDAILPRPPHEIRAEMDQLNERSQKLRAEIRAQVFITNIDSNAYDGKKVRAINKEIRYITRRYKELEKEVEKGIRMGAPTPKTTAEATPAAEASPAPEAKAEASPAAEKESNTFEKSRDEQNDRTSKVFIGFSSYPMNFPIHTKVRGVTYENRQEYLKESKEGDILLVEHDPSPEFPNAISVVNKRTGKQLGFVSSELAHELLDAFGDGCSFNSEILEVTGGGQRNWGCNFIIWGPAN